MVVGSMGQVDRGGLEPTDHGLDLNTDVLGKLLRAEVGLLELQDQLIDLGLVASATALDVMHPRPSPGSDWIGNHGVRRTLTFQVRLLIRQLRLDAMLRVAESSRRFASVGIERPELWEAVGSKELKSGSDLVLRCRFIQLWLNHVVIVWKCWRTGMMDSSDWETCCRDIESILSLPAVREEWFRVQGFYPLRFQEDMARLCLRVGEAEARE